MCGAMRIFFLSIALLSSSVHAALSLDILGGELHKVAIAIQPFSGEPAVATELYTVVMQDLHSCGLFDTQSGPIQKVASVVLTGSVQSWDGGHGSVIVRLVDVARHADLGGRQYMVTGSYHPAVHNIAHRIADFVHQEVTGIPGYFVHHVVYVAQQGPSYAIERVDADGGGDQVLVQSAQPLLSPHVSPNGLWMSFVSFAHHKPVLYIADMISKKTRILADFEGSNFSPSWSPDSQSIAAVLSQDGLPQIYLLDSGGHRPPQRVMNSGSMDTEPAFSADGAALYFSSDREHSPQIYRVRIGDGQVERMTFVPYAVSPALSPDGRWLAFVEKTAQGFCIAVMDLTTRVVRVLTTGPHDLSPSFSSNSRMLVFSAESADRSKRSLMVISVDGLARYRLSAEGVRARQPTWAP